MPTGRKIARLTLELLERAVCPVCWTLRTRDGSLSAHYEHTLVITRGRPVVLTAEAA